MNKPVHLRHDASEDSEDPKSLSPGSSENGSVDEESGDSATTDSSGLASGGEDEEGSDAETEGSEVESSDGNRAAKSTLKSLSFGALAEAQAQFPPKSRKRKLPNDFGQGTQASRKDSPPQQADKREQLRPKQTRQSKHAPTILSSKHQVSRRRDVFEPSPSIKSRDPRFDASIQASNHDPSAVEKANKNYSFLTTYQAAEILELKAQIKKTKDPEAVADLKHRVMAFENKVRSAEAKQRERDIEKQHQEKEKELIRTGQKSKPYYLKPGEIKKLAEKERLEGMGAKARAKALQKKQKREKSKEARHMPRVRRE